MRPTFISALTLAATLAAVPALAQNAPDARVTPPASAGQEQGSPQLQQAEQRLQQAAEQLQQAAQSGDQKAIDQARQEAQQALEAVRQAMDEVPPDQRQQVQQRADRAEEALQGQDTQAGTQAVFALVEVIGLVAVPDTGQPTQSAGADIAVQQRAPQITVQQPPPQVTVTRQAPEVTITQPKPQVTIQQPAPNVTVERAKPEVTIQQQGQPDVDVQRSGQADVQVVQQGGGGSGQPEPTGQEAQGGSQSPLYAMTADELMGKTVYGSNGEEIGEVDQVVVGREGAPAAIVGVGGFLGIGEHDVAIPLDQLQPGEGDRLTTGMTKDQIGSMESYDASNYRPLDGNRTIGEAASG